MMSATKRLVLPTKSIILVGYLDIIDFPAERLDWVALPSTVITTHQADIHRGYIPKVPVPRVDRFSLCRDQYFEIKASELQDISQVREHSYLIVPISGSEKSYIVATNRIYLGDA